jgi:acetyltransferase
MRRTRHRGAQRVEGCGIGYLLMTRLIEVACEPGIGELFGEVLHENKPMLDMCRALGFSLTTNAKIRR